MTGTALKVPSEEDVSRYVSRTAVEQYGTDSLEAFNRLAPSQRVAIIDDWHKCNANRTGRTALLELLATNFEVLAVLGNDQLRFLTLDDGEPDTTTAFMWTFRLCEILPFGHARRGDLIQKWYSIGRLHTEDEGRLHDQIVRAERAISSLLKEYFVPPFPIYVLLFLQQIEAHSASASVSGSQGYIYDVLIMATLTLLRRFSAWRARDAGAIVVLRRERAMAKWASG